MENQHNLHLNEQAVEGLRESAKWSTFLAILGFVGIGFMLLASIFAGLAMSAIPDDPYGAGMNPFGGIMGFLPLIYIVMAVVYFFPVLYLYKYAKGMKEALNFENSDTLSEACVQLGKHHKFLGIMVIVLISLYIISVIGMVAFFASMAGGM
jgi:O-antigen ligase